MEEKKDYASYFDEMKEAQNAKAMKPWQEMTTVKIKIPAKIEAPRISLWDKILLRGQNSGHKVCSNDQSLDDLSCFLLQVRSRFLTLLYSTATYSIYPQQEIEIVTTHRQMTKQFAAGIVDVYHKGQRTIRSQWNLSLSGEKLLLEVSCPLAVSRQLTALEWRYYPQLLKCYWP